MTTVYVVMGTVGEYSDASTWPVVAYTDETRAAEHARVATETLAAICANDALRERLAYYDPEPTAEDMARLSRVDPTLVLAIGGGQHVAGRFCYGNEPATYGVVRVPLSEVPPTAEVRQ